MAKSMTGYGRARSLVGGRDITFEGEQSFP